MKYVLTVAVAASVLYLVASLILVVPVASGFRSVLLVVLLAAPLATTILVLTVFLMYLAFLLKRGRRIQMGRIMVTFVSTLVVVAGVAAGWQAPDLARPNAFGLLAFSPDSTQMFDASNDPNKDGYPVCTFQYNSFGYRDEQPDLTRNQGRRILVIGDSYIWGDGIPSNTQTLTARLRAELSGGKEDAYQVIQAAVPGIGLYGYAQFAKKLAPALRPQLILIGYLGGSDLHPIDYQYLMDSLPPSQAIRNLMVNLGVVRRVNRVCLRYAALSVEDSSVALARAENAMSDLSRISTRQSTKIVFVTYGHPVPRLPIREPLGQFEVPEPMRYKGVRNELWYEKDAHPKPAFNAKLAPLLADAVRRYFEEGDDDLFAPAAYPKGEFPPGDPSPCAPNGRIQGGWAETKAGSVSISAQLLPAQDSTSCLTLVFDSPMAESSSFACPCEVFEHLWSDDHTFRILMRPHLEDGALPLELNPKEDQERFRTAKGLELPNHRLRVRVSIP